MDWHSVARCNRCKGETATAEEEEDDEAVKEEENETIHFGE